MVSFWQVIITMLIFGSFIIFSFYLGYNAGLKKDNLLKEKDLPEPVNMFSDYEDEETD